MSRKIAIFTGTRAEYGLLHWLMRDVQNDPDLTLQVIVGAMHLSPEFGQTWKEIAADGFSIDAKVEMLLSSDTAVGVAKSMGLGVLAFADALDRLSPDMLVVLGDRFEALAIVQTAMVLRIPVAHIHGGEVTEGAYDDAIRHAITKMASLHFVAAEPYARRVIQMGTPPERVFNVGAVGLDQIKREEAIDRTALSAELGFDLVRPYVLVTYHPVTAGAEDPVKTTEALLNALDTIPDHQVILTFPNADNGGRAIIPLLKAYAARDSARVLALPSLGFRRYKAAMAGVSAVIGNSSSGIIEAPSFRVPTVNIGVRQHGRLAASSVLNCAADEHSITETIKKALSADVQISAQGTVNPYGAGDATRQIIAALKANLGPFPQTFYDLEAVL
ncbi:MAG TPA: UDP-N-acetylglucosamine 2-epimerase (hydrolyzing) [Roseobacter sp.]|uniref:UDP-N-acetylglucosamine 2-epimerase domain-containing protein n=1 Tax=marine sediment metagenome TaxID=412755 RepID=A0A0F9T8K6_9ZZZZ|nr:UDP-N-acetylglucosamine 2-epimerase (hydrolyzing) [Roseobacter sp.]|tara:strand:- start:1385 stop:2548 length:1164 start_codon:yes stop_codon:yes gene_type:complete